MIRFDPFPVTINGSRIDELVRATVEEGIASGLIEPSRRIGLLRASNRFDYSSDSGPDARHYESRVLALLSAIKRTEPGLALLTVLKEGLPVWIAPYDTQQKKIFGTCNAVTGHAVREHTNGPQVRIAFSPEDWSYNSCGFYPGLRADEVLFHEMVHAYRSGSPAVPVMNNDPLPDNQDFEEFLANQVTNVYRSTKGAQKFNRDYLTKRLVSATECEAALWGSPALMDAIEWFLGGDPLVLEVAKIKTTYNPFANFDQLKARAAARP